MSAATTARCEADTLATVTAEAVTTATRLLSPTMLPLFLRWGSMAAGLSDERMTDDEGNRLCATFGDTRDTIFATPATNAHDLAFKTYVLLIEATDAPAPGPLLPTSERDDGDMLCEASLLIYRDLAVLSPLPALLERLASEAGQASPNPLAWSRNVALTIAAAFAAEVL